MLNIGCHLSSTGGFVKMFEAALEIGANTFQYFTRNPRGGKAKEIDKNDVSNYIKIAREKSFAKIIAHASYTLNLCSAQAHIRAFSKDIFTDDLTRAEFVPGSYYNFHPGSHVGQGTDVGIEQIVKTLNEALNPSQTTTVLLETMAGKGSEVGGKFEELKKIIDNVNLKDKIGVCLDTCHIFDAGYDIVNNLDGVLEEFDRIIGITKLKAVHLNDSKNPLGSKKDRHEMIGRGYIGLDTFVKIINHPNLRDLPFVLETPQESFSGYAEEISLLRSRFEN